MKVHEATVAFVNVPLVSAERLNRVTILLIVGTLLQGDPDLEFNVVANVTWLPSQNLDENRIEAPLQSRAIDVDSRSTERFILEMSACDLLGLSFAVISCKVALQISIALSSATVNTVPLLFSAQLAKPGALVPLTLELKLSKHIVRHHKENQNFWCPQQFVTSDLVTKSLQISDS